MEIFRIVVLVLSALLLTLVGAMRLSNPINTYSRNSGIELANDVNLLNEIRGVSALMLFGGVVIALGTFIPELTFSSFIVATLMFLGFAVGRMLSMGLDGKPNKLLIQGLIFELVFGALNVFGLVNIMV